MEFLNTAYAKLEQIPTYFAETFDPVKAQISSSASYVNTWAKEFIANNATAIHPATTAAGSYLIIKSAIDLSYNHSTRSNLKALAKMTAGSAAIYLTLNQGDSNHLVTLGSGIAGSALSAVLNAKNYHLYIQLPQSRKVIKITN